jgi:RNA recognition motif-containing protein
MTKLYFGNLPFSATEDIPRHIFEDCGLVQKVTLIRDSATGRSRGYAFIEMGADDAAADAIARFHGDTYDGRVVTVQRARG